MEQATSFTPSGMVQRINAQSQRPGRRPGKGIISLASGDPDFATPEYIRQALIEAVQGGYTHYADNQGDPELRAALAEQLSRQAGTPYAPEQILMTHGGSGAVTASMLGALNPGDRVLLPNPTYSLYADAAVMAGAEPVYVPQRPDFHLDLDALEAAASAPGARMVVLCHPNNPTGVVYRPDELEALGQLAARHDLLVLADEAYEHIVYDGVEFVSTVAIPALRERLYYCQTFSKTYAMTGWRLGFVAAPAPMTAAAARIHRTFTGPLNSALQRAGLAAVTTPSNAPEEMCREYASRRELVNQLMGDVPGVSFLPPEGTFYTFFHYEADVPAREVVAAALERGVAIRAGTEYGPAGKNYVRIAFSSSREDITEGLMRLRALLAGLDQ